MATDFKSLGRNDQGALITGALAVIFTFIGSYITVSVKVTGFERTAGHNAWDGWGTFASLLLILAFAVVVVRVFAGSNLPDGVPWNLVTFAVAALATVILVIKGLTFGPDVPAVAQSSLDAGVGWSGWILFVLAIAFSVFSFLTFKDSGEQIPEINKQAPPAA